MTTCSPLAQLNSEPGRTEDFPSAYLDANNSLPSQEEFTARCRRSSQWAVCRCDVLQPGKDATLIAPPVNRTEPNRPSAHDAHLRTICARTFALARLAIVAVCCLTAVAEAQTTGRRANVPSGNSPTKTTDRATASAPSRSATHIEFPQPSPAQTLSISAERASRWRQGNYDVWLLRGNCTLSQGQKQAKATEAVLWIDHGDRMGSKPTEVVAYLEDKVTVRHGHLSNQQQAGRLSDRSWFGHFVTYAPLQLRTPSPTLEPRVKPAVYQRGMRHFDESTKSPIQRAQFLQPEQVPAGPNSLPPGTRRLRAFPRSDVRVQAQWFPSANGQEWVAVVSNGVNLIVDGLENVGTIDIAADRIVVWTSGQQPDLTGQSTQSNDTPLEIYMEGNIVFRQGEREIFANRMYYDVSRHIGVVLDAELLTPMEGYAGLLRLKSNVLQQVTENTFVAHGAQLTTSRMGEPKYRFESGQILFEDQQTPIIDPNTGEQLIDPLTGQPAVDRKRLATSRNNFLYLGNIPVLYWPTMATDLDNPTFYINSLDIKNDSVFGTQVLLDVDMYQVLGIRNPPEGTDWSASLDLLTKRGLGYGTLFEYQRSDVFGFGGPNEGFADLWAIYDTGRDNLGRDRNNLVPEKRYRGRILANHRQYFDYFTLSAEVGLISDRNFLEQYFETEWDERKDLTTGFELKHLSDITSWSVTSDVRLNDFFTQTEWLPRIDHYWIGQPILFDYLTWFEHSSAGFGRLRTADAPQDPTENARWSQLRWEAKATGGRFATRQEVDLPFSLGPVKVVPYALGELAHWGEDINQESIQRIYYQLGARASVSFWAVDPTIENNLLNVHGLAHKVVFEAEFGFAESNRDISKFPLYDPVDDDSIEAFRRRMAVNTFGLPKGSFVPLRFDERLYAVRSGLASWVTSPSTEVADDLTFLRAGMRHRWQTKRGRPGARRIVDWLVFDTNATLFPKYDRDNFGQPLGQVDYDARWHMGDRFSLLSSGFFDFFGDGLQVWTIGGYLNRPPRGGFYAGFRSIEGPVSSNVAALSFSYWMSPKWVSEFGTSFDLGDAGNIGQNFSLTRVGESLLVSLGVNIDSGKDNVGVSLIVEPRFLPNARLVRSSNVQVWPAGARGLE